MKPLSKVNAITGLAELATAQSSQHPYPRGPDTFSQQGLLQEGRGICGKGPTQGEVTIHEYGSVD